MIQRIRNIVYVVFVGALALVGTPVAAQAPYTIPPPFTPVACERFGASPAGSASANTVALQNCLNRGGSVSLTSPGTYQINNTLVGPQGGHWHLTLGDGVTIQEAAG